MDMDIQLLDNGEVTVVPVLSSLHILPKHEVQFKNCPLDPRLNWWGSYSMEVGQRPMTKLDKLIFVSSFIIMLQWGVRLTQVGINALY